MFLILLLSGLDLLLKIQSKFPFFCLAVTVEEIETSSFLSTSSISQQEVCLVDICSLTYLDIYKVCLTLILTPSTAVR